jgi:hypothetical protein
MLNYLLFGTNRVAKQRTRVRVLINLFLVRFELFQFQHQSQQRRAALVGPPSFITSHNDRRTGKKAIWRVENTGLHNKRPGFVEPFPLHLVYTPNLLPFFPLSFSITITFLVNLVALAIDAHIAPELWQLSHRQLCGARHGTRRLSLLFGNVRYLRWPSVSVYLILTCDRP